MSCDRKLANLPVNRAKDFSVYSKDVARPLNDADFSRIRSLIHDKTGITIAENRKSMVYSRLQGRLRELGDETFQDYLNRAIHDQSELQELIDRITTNKTLFYRTPRIWKHFQDICIPSFKLNQNGRPMRVWSAAASTGEEGYTIGMVMAKEKQSNPPFDYSVLGTDISMRVLSIAEAGIYQKLSIDRFRKERPDLCEDFITGNEQEGFSVKSNIKQRIKFKRHNLLEPLRNGGPFDVVFLRNVLIYFTDDDQKKILERVHQQLRPNGTLIIGESESLKSLDCNFEAIEPLIYRPTTMI